MKQWQAYYNEDELLHFYQECLVVNHKALLDLMSLEFNLAEFVFYPKLAAYYRANTESGANEKIGYYSALVYLSTKIHFHIATNCENHQAYRQGVQFPILIGDLLYGQAIKAVSQDEDKTLLEDYLIYLKNFNQIMIDYLNNTASEEKVYQAQFADLAKLTYRLMYRNEDALAKTGAKFATEVFVKGTETSEDEFVKEILKDSKEKILSWKALEEKLQNKDA